MNLEKIEFDILIPKDNTNGVKVVTVDMTRNYISIIKSLFPKVKIVLDRFHIV